MATSVEVKYSYPNGDEHDRDQHKTDICEPGGDAKAAEDDQQRRAGATQDREKSDTTDELAVCHSQSPYGPMLEG